MHRKPHFSQRYRHRLLWKILLIFWGALALTILVNQLLTRALAERELKERLASARIEDMGSTAASIFESGGVSALDHYLIQMAHRHGIRALLLDSQGKPLSQPEFRRGRPLDRHTEPPPHPPRPGRSFRLSEFSLRIPVESSTDHAYQLAVLPSQFTRDLVAPSTIRWQRFLSTFIIIALASWLLNRHIVSPIEVLSKASRKMAEGDLSVRSRPEIGSRRDELGAMSDDFDRMAERIEALVRTQQKLFSNLSHELRTPLTRQRLALELLSREQASPLIDKIAKSCDELDAITGQILELSKLQSGAERLHCSPLSLTAVVQQLCDNNQWEAELKHVRFLVEPHPPSGTFRISGDETLLYRAMENILRNAIKHAPEQSTITVRLTETADTVMAEFMDEGPGVPSDKLPHLFDAFYRTDDARNKALGGFGLGLAIAREAVARHKGTISALNRPHPAHGLIVRIEIPRHS